MLPNEIVSIGEPAILQTTGKVWFVCSLGGQFGAATSGAGIGEDPGQPFRDITTAYRYARANKGDTIIVMPGHVENVSAAAGLLFDKAGVAIIGMGWGASRPTIRMANTAATIRITGAGTVLRNMLITPTVDEHVVAFEAQAADVILDEIDFIEGATQQTRSFLTSTAAATGLQIRNCKHYQASAPGAAAAWISLVGTHRARIVNNEFFIAQANNAASFIIQSLTTAPTNILIARNRIVQLGGTTIAAVISLLAATSGRVDDNRISTTSATAIVSLLALADCYAAENYVGNEVNKSGIISPTLDT